MAMAVLRRWVRPCKQGPEPAFATTMFGGWQRSRNSFAEPQRASSLKAADRAAATGQSSDYGLIPAAEAARSAFSELPTELTAAIMVIEIPTTISPYSMAVAPDSLDQK